MTESLSSLLMKNIDLILEAYTVDNQGNLIEANKRKVRESDEVFHDYFVKSMNRMFRQINEADPIMNDPDMMSHPMGMPDRNGIPTKFGSNSPIGTPARLRDQNQQSQNGMNSRNGMDTMGQDQFGQQDEFGGQDEFGDDMLGDMAMNDMHAGMDQMNPGMGQGQMGDQYGGQYGDQMGDQMGGQYGDQMGEEDPYAPDNMNAMGNDQSMGMDGGMGGGGMAGGGMSGGGAAMESANYDWVFNEQSDLDVDSLFNLSEEDDDEEEDDDQLNEFMDDMHDPDDHMGMHGGGMGGGMGGGGMGGGGMGGGMDMGGGQNDFGGDMAGGDMMGGGMGGDDMGGGGDMMGGDEEMVTIHGTTDGGGEFEFSFDPSTLGFGGEDEMGGDEMGGGGDEFGGGGDEDMGGGEEEPDFGGGGGGDEHHFGGGGEDEEEEKPFHEAAGRKPGKGKRGIRTAKMAVVPKNPAAGGAVPFPTAQGQRQKRK